MPASQGTRTSHRALVLAVGLVALAAAALIAAIVSWPSADAAPGAEAAANAPATPKPTVASPSVPLIPPAPALDLPIAGWVIDGAGAPIAAVQIVVRDATGATADHTVISEADGAFRIAAPADGGERTLRLDAPNVFPAEVRWQTGGAAPRILLTRRMQLDARVTEAGAPVVGAEVHLSDGSGPTLATVRTGSDGVAHFADLLPGAYELWARRDAAVSPLLRTVHEGPAPLAEVALTLAPGGGIRGRVTGAGALPAGAAVLLVPVELDHAARLATVDGDGRFAIDGVPRGRWRLEAEAPGYIRDATREVAVKPGPAGADVVVALRRAGVVTGTVVDAAGAPVVNATLVLRGQGAGQHGSHADTVAIQAHDTASPSARLRWVHPLATTRQMPYRDSRRFGAARAGSRPAECGRGHCGVDLGGVRGVTVHAAADGVIARLVPEIRKEAGRYIVIEHAGGLRSFYMHLDDLRGDLELGQVIRAGEPIGTVGRTGVIKNAPHLHFAIAQERHGRTLYIDPEPILRHAVVLSVAGSIDSLAFGAPDSFVAGPATDRPGDAAAAGAAPPTVIASVRWSELAGAASPAAPAAPRFTTDARGQFRLEGITPGSYVAAAFAAELAPGVSDAFEVRIGEETGGVLITLSRGVRVEGRVLGRDGAIRGARIVAEEGFGETAHKVATAFTDADGHYQLRSLSGKLTLSVTAAGYGTVERSIALPSRDVDGALRREDFELSTEDAQLYGVVLEPGGAPAGAVSVRIVDGPTRNRRTITAPDGRFVLDRLAAGSYRVELASADHPSLRAELDTDARAELRLVAGGSLRLLLLDAHTGAGLVGLRVDVGGPAGATRAITTDAGGVAVLRALPVGSWTVRARAAGYVAGARTVEVAPSKLPAEVRLELHRGAILAGVVRDRYGRRVAGARVWIGEVSTHTDGDGTFRIDDAPTGSVELFVEQDALRGSLPLELRPGDELITLKVDVAE